MAISYENPYEDRPGWEPPEIPDHLINPDDHTHSASAILYDHDYYENVKDALDALFATASEYDVVVEVLDFENNPIEDLRVEYEGNFIEDGAKYTDADGQITLEDMQGTVTVTPEDCEDAETEFDPIMIEEVHAGQTVTIEGSYTGEVEEQAIYYGVQEEPEEYDEDFIIGLQGIVEDAEDQEHEFTVNVPENEYVYYSYPADWGEAEFWHGGLEGGFQEEEAAVEVGNTDFILYRSSEHGLGDNVNIEVEEAEEAEF